MDTLFEFARKQGFTGGKSRIPNKYKILYEIQQNPTKWKQHPIYIHLWFERNLSRCLNTKKGWCPQGGHCLRPVAHRIQKWETFYGDIPNDTIIRFKNSNLSNDKRFSLDNLECISLACLTCKKYLPESRHHNQKYCSVKCRLVRDHKYQREKYQSDLSMFVANKARRYKMNYDYCMNLIKVSGGHCNWCGIKCLLYGGTGFNYDTISFDAVIASAGHIIGNITISCQLCNLMKQLMELSPWLLLLEFLKKPELLKLNLSSFKFINSYEPIKEQMRNHPEPWGQLKTNSPKYYKVWGAPFKTFQKIFQKQKGVDGIFNFFPLLYLTRRNHFNVSCDAIDSNLPDEEKHRPDNIQILPLFLNHAKNKFTIRQLKEAFERRNFKTDYSECKVILPEKYKSESWLEYKIQTGKRTGKGRKN
tara:strand:- start:1546 stop:2799 length:1254 start_codon:yes stop_codon:yes gene_type:complete